MGSLTGPSPTLQSEQPCAPSDAVSGQQQEHAASDNTGQALSYWQDAMDEEQQASHAATGGANGGPAQQGNLSGHWLARQRNPATWSMVFRSSADLPRVRGPHNSRCQGHQNRQNDNYDKWVQKMALPRDFSHVLSRLQHTTISAKLDVNDAFQQHEPEATTESATASSTLHPGAQMQLTPSVAREPSE